jgi:hypothetical protein
MNRSIDRLTAARAEALFTSPLSADLKLTRAEVTDSIRRAVRAHGGTRGCAIELAGEYGEHPETAIPRMRWALRVVEATYAVSVRRSVMRIRITEAVTSQHGSNNGLLVRPSAETSTAGAANSGRSVRPAAPVAA